MIDSTDRSVVHRTDGMSTNGSSRRRTSDRFTTRDALGLQWSRMFLLSRISGRNRVSLLNRAVRADRADRTRWVTRASCSSTNNGSDDFGPFLRIGCCVGFELDFGGAGELATNAFADIFAFNTEFLAVSAADYSIWKVDGELGDWVSADVVAVFELVEIFAWGDDVISSRVAAHAELVAGLPL